MKGGIHPNQNRRSAFTWKALALCMMLTIIPWAVYVNFHPRLDQILHVPSDKQATGAEASHKLGQLRDENGINKLLPTKPNAIANTASVPVVVSVSANAQLPVLGPVPTDGTKPLFGYQHKGTDAIFALACNYPKVYYQRFVGSLRKFGYTEDIVLAVSPRPKMKPGVDEYLKDKAVLAYEFDVDCQGTDNCRLKDEFLGYPDPRPHRTFANIRYALYEYWLRHYSDKSYILILDFRDTFFQANPFASFGPYQNRKGGAYELHMYAENYDVKNIGICVFNSNWIKTCFGKPALEALRPRPVICSGSTLGSYTAVNHYIRTMLSNMDTVKCWLKGIESDQGYQNYLFYNGMFNTPQGNATLYMQGTGVVNTIGAMNGFRVPKEKKGPLGTFWKARDQEGYVINKDGSRSACVHQWDRWFDELHGFIDKNLFD